MLTLFTQLHAQSSPTEFRPERIEQTATFTVHTSLDQAFPLFGPVRERDWAAGWEPKIIFSSDPLVEEHMLFQTQPRFENEPPYLWVVSQFRPEQYFIEYSVSTNERIWFVSVQCAAAGEHTRVTVRYRFTGLTPRGNELNRVALDRMYAQQLKDWESELNQFLSTPSKK